MKIPKDVLKEMGYIDDVDLFTAVVLVNYLTKDKKKDFADSIIIASNYYRVNKGKLMRWIEKLENAFATIKRSSSPRSGKEGSAECTEWEQQMSKLEALIL